MLETLLLLITTYPSYAYALIAIFSLLIGSLLNVFIYRLPLMLHQEWNSQCRAHLKLEEIATEPPINLFFPRSFCPQCKSLVKAWQNIPIISYCFLRGRCAHCKTPISIQYPLVEFLSMALSLFAAWHFGFNLQLIYSLLFIWVLLVLCFIDLKHQILPDSLTLSLLWIGLVANSKGIFTDLNSAVYGAIFGYLSLWLFVKLFYLITGKIGMGHGDFKLFAAFGAWLGWTQLPLIIFFSSIVGVIIGSIYLKCAKQSHDTPIPFGPYLCLAGLISLMYGNTIITWYLQHMMGMM